MNRRQLLEPMACLGLAVLLLAGCAGSQVEATATPTPLPPTPTATPTAVPPPSTGLARLDGKRALFVIYDRFHEDELGVPRAILENLGVVVAVGSVTTDAVKGHRGAEVQPDVLLGDARAGDYDAIIFVGGSGYDVDDPEAQRIAQEAVAEGKVVAAICIAPITLARAGVVEGKRVTVAMHPHELEEAGAIYTGAGFEHDGLIITANSPGGARRVGEAVATALGE
jgi:protease I